MKLFKRPPSRAATIIFTQAMEAAQRVTRLARIAQTSAEDAAKFAADAERTLNEARDLLDSAKKLLDAEQTEKEKV